MKINKKAIVIHRAIVARGITQRCYAVGHQPNIKNCDYAPLSPANTAHKIITTNTTHIAGVAGKTDKGAA